MPASYPGTIKTFTDKIDNVDDVMAADVNDAYAEITAIETELGPSSAFVRTSYDGTLINGKLSVTVASGDLTVAIVSASGGTPSASNPVRVRIASEWRDITAATSVTAAKGTNYGGRGSSETAGLEVDWFAYAIWNTGPATDIVDIGFSPIPYGTIYSDFSATAADQNYLKYGNATQPNSTDNCAVIGRFAATLGAGATYDFSVPTFDTNNLIQRPIFETRVLEWLPTQTGFSSATTGGIYRYIIMGRRFQLTIREPNAGGTSNATTFTMTSPLTCRTITSMVWDFPCAVDDNSVGLSTPGIIRLSTASNIITFFKDFAPSAFTASGTKRCRSGFIQGEI